MEINVTRKQEGAKLTLFVEGKLGVSSAPTLKNELVDLSGIKELVMDLEKVSYVASAGFRVFIEAYRKMEDNNGTFRIVNVTPENMEVFRYTGLADVMDVSQA
ncbi:MAG: STAS domain-containing protein [Clostridia bacterium]|nr:STAS domain-containing protein [Clostridia bacterium]